MKSGLSELSVLRRRKAALVLAVLIAAAGYIWRVHDSVTLALLVGAAGLIWSTRGWKAWLLTGAMVAAGLLWSRMDGIGCSAWWRASVVYEKRRGHLPYVEWTDVQRKALGPCYALPKPHPEVEKSIHQVEEKVVEGRKWELYQTELGKFWLTAPGKELLTWLVWEMRVQRVYESREVTIRPGDTVIDCGAHVGVFSRYALRRGAGRVIAIEPEPGNLACLETNLAEEISPGRVSVVRAGVWDENTRLTFFHFDENPAQDTFLRRPQKAAELEGMQVLPLDEIVEQLGLERVDFIKMDIEGSERNALRGARKTIARFKPRMAICTYHVDDDPGVIPAIVKEIESSYRIHAKDIEVIEGKVRTKTLFFD